MCFLNKEYDRNSIFEFLEIMKKDVIENHKGSLEELRMKIADIEKQRIEVIKGNKEVMDKIINDYKKINS